MVWGYVACRRSWFGSDCGDLGIRTTGAASITPVVGSDLNLLVSNQTQLSQLFGGIGIPNASMMTIRQNGRDYNVNTAGMETVEDLINGIEASGARCKPASTRPASIYHYRAPRAEPLLSVGEVAGGNLAARLGVRTFDTSTPVSRLNFGQGIFGSDNGADLRIKRTDGTELVIELDGVQTVGDVIDKINSHVDNFDPLLRSQPAWPAAAMG